MADERWQVHCEPFVRGFLKMEKLSHAHDRSGSRQILEHKVDNAQSRLGKIQKVAWRVNHRKILDRSFGSDPSNT